MEPSLATAFNTRIAGTLDRRLTRQARHLASQDPDNTVDDHRQVMLLKLWEQTRKTPGYLQNPDVHLFAYATWKSRSLATRGRTYTKYVEAEKFVTDEDGDELSAFEFISDGSQDPDAAFEFAESLGEAWVILGEIEKTIVRMLYQGYSQVEIARTLGISKACVTQRKQGIAQVFAMCDL